MKRQILKGAISFFIAVCTFNTLPAQENYNQFTGYSYDCGCGDECDCDGCCAYENKCCDVLRNTIYIGPDIYSVKRIKEGKAHQTGVLYGVRGGYDRIKRYNFYVGFEGAWAQGQLTGSTTSDFPLKSNLTDAEVEGRFGYTIATKHECQAAFTPFVGVGYFCQTNKFVDPSPRTLHFEDSFTYTVVGFLSNIYLIPCLSTGLNFKAKFIYDGKSWVTNDPEVIDADGTRLVFSNRVQYEVDLPITYYFGYWNQNWTASIVPFYIFRHYGFFDSFPDPFYDTKYYNYGARLLLGFQF